jgi:uncharacterized membrane protein YeiH
VFPFPDAIFGWYDLIATFFWALSGAMLAARKGYDIMGVFIIAFVSSTGGGMLRDCLFLPGSAAPKVIQTPNYLIIVAIVVAIVIVFGRWLRHFRWLPRFLTLADALGIGAYGAVGMYLAVASGIPLAGSMLIGVINAVGGGALRDLLMGEKVELLQPSVLMGLAAVVGCGLFAVLLELDVSGAWAGAAAAFTAFAIRLLALRFNVRSRALSAFEEDWRHDPDGGKSPP